MTEHNLQRSIRSAYLRFTRVDSYLDFPGADENDGNQLLQDSDINSRSTFERDPNFSMRDYYDQSRSRTYACCFSTENSNYIWENYANEEPDSKACVIFDLEKLRRTLNEVIRNGALIVESGNAMCDQIFSISYGMVKYIDWHSYRMNIRVFPNPIEYAFLKDERFREEKEFRISLSALGIGKFTLNDRRALGFPSALNLEFSFEAALSDGTIKDVIRKRL